MSTGRSNLGFGDELESFDPQAWTPPAKTSNDRPQPAHTKEAAEAAGFQSRPTGQGSQVPRTRRRRTGRNAQFNIKTTPEAIAAFTAIADELDWGLGETFEKAIPLLEREYSGQREK